jgi:ribosomal 30S subunit maturation factor RimM
VTLTSISSTAYCHNSICNTTARYRDHVIYVAENERPELAEDEYMVTDLVGMKAYLDPARQQYVGEVVGVVVMDDLGTVAAKGQVSVLHYYCV